ncbi:hypothetical protein [Shimazuella kribbensis]|uniref:hypothetical protein n=1 Tax=Shimazuella kribbensis TaxID=139808 RepID=UPI000403B60A|nr:hypothetical protein [Shimazuella kribbensis]
MGRALYFQDRKNDRIYIEFVKEEDTNKLYMWNIEEGKMITNKEVQELLKQIKHSLETVDQKEINDINNDILKEEIKEHYLKSFEIESSYTNHVLQKEYRADGHGHVVFFEDRDQYIYFDCTKKSTDKTLVDLLNRLRQQKSITVHHVFEATEAKKLCNWLERLFSPGICRNAFLGGEEIIRQKPYSPNFKNYLIQSLKEYRNFPKGILDLILD